MEIPRILERRDVEMSPTSLTQDNLAGRVVRIRQDAGPAERASEGLHSNNGKQDNGKDNVESDGNKHRSGDFERM